MWEKIFDKKQKYFIIFLVIHTLVWSILPLIRHLLPVDALEGIVWGSYQDLGTHKHPPLAGWITYFFYHISNHFDYLIYLAGQICVVIGFIFVYKLAKMLMDEDRALCSVMILEGCFTYSYMSIFDGFNPNFLIIMFFPMISYYFYLVLKNDKWKDWMILGFLVGLAMLSKYQSMLLVLSMFLVVIICKKYRKIFLNYKLYLSGIIAFSVNLPHLFWLIINKFFPWAYFDFNEKTGFLVKLSETGKFFAEQMLAVAGLLIIFLIGYFIFRKDKTERNINFEDAIFILFTGFMPIIIQVIMSILGNTRLIGTWGYPMLFMTGITLYYFFPVKITKEYFGVFLKSVYSVMTILFLTFFILFSVEKNFRSTYPYERIAEDFKTIYKQETGKDLKYITGCIEYALPITVYDKTHPQIIFDTYGYKNIWIDEEDVKKSGVLIFSPSEDVPYETLVPYLSDKKDYKVYKFTIQNKLKMKREYNIYYKILNK